MITITNLTDAAPRSERPAKVPRPSPCAASYKHVSPRFIPRACSRPFNWKTQMGSLLRRPEPLIPRFHLEALFPSSPGAFLLSESFNRSRLLARFFPLYASTRRDSAGHAQSARDGHSFGVASSFARVRPLRRRTITRPPLGDKGPFIENVDERHSFLRRSPSEMCFRSGGGLDSGKKDTRVNRSVT